MCGRCEQVGFISHATVAYIGGLFAGRESVDQVSGPVAITQIAGEMAKISLWEVVNLAALFSVSVGLMNLLPVPLLDGGHLLFYLFEALRGRPVSERVQQFGMRVGIALVAALMIFTTSHDICPDTGRSKLTFVDHACVASATRPGNWCSLGLNTVCSVAQKR